MRKVNSHDIFNASRLLGKIGYKKVLQNILKEVEGNKNEEEVGIIIISLLLDAISSSEDFEEAFFDFVSGPLEMNPTELKEMPPMDLIELVKTFVEQEDKETWKAFWNTLAKLMH